MQIKYEITARLSQISYSNAFFQLNLFFFSSHFDGILDVSSFYLSHDIFDLHVQSAKIAQLNSFFFVLVKRAWCLTRSPLFFWVYMYNLEIVLLGSMCISKIDFMVKRILYQLAHDAHCTSYIRFNICYAIFFRGLSRIFSECEKKLHTGISFVIFFFFQNFPSWLVIRFYHWSALNLSQKPSWEWKKKKPLKLSLASTWKTFSSFHFKRFLFHLSSLWLVKFCFLEHALEAMSCRCEVKWTNKTDMRKKEKKTAK